MTDSKRDQDAILREAGEGAFTRIERVDPRSGKSYFCGEFPTKMVSKQFCVERFGGGDYLLETRRRTPGGGSVYGNRVRFSVDPNVKPIDSVAAAPDKATAPGSWDSLAAGFVQQQLESMRTFQALNLELLDGARKSRFDWSALVPLVPIATALIEKMGRRGRGDQDPVQLALEIMRAMQPEEREHRGLSEIADELEALEQLRARFGGEGGAPRDGVLDTVNRGLSIAEKFAERMMAARPNRGPVAGGARQAAAAPDTEPEALEAEPAPAAALGEGVEDVATAKLNHPAPWVQAFTAQLPQIPQLATWMPPESAAGIAYENMDDAAFASLDMEVAAFPKDGATEPASVAAKWADGIVAKLDAPAWPPAVRAWFAAALQDLAVRVLENHGGAA